MRTRDQIIQHVKYWTKGREPSEAGLRVAELLERWQGLHHLDDGEARKADWCSFYVELVTHSGIATFDFNELTTLVFLSHDMAIRVDVAGKSSGRLRIMFHPRDREGSIAKRHPTIEDALAKWREGNPAPAAASEGGAA